MTRRRGSGIQYDGCEMTYTFKGERLTGPLAKVEGFRMYSVRMNRGLWWLSVCGQQVDSGDELVPSRANARKIVMKWRAKCGQESND